MSDEKIKILKLLEDGKVSAEEATRLLDAVGHNSYVEDDDFKPAGKSRWIKVRVYENGKTKPKVNVNVPLAVAKMAMKIGGKLSQYAPDNVQDHLKEKGIDPDILNDIDKLEELIDSLSSEGPFKLVDVDDEESGDKVEITIE